MGGYVKKGPKSKPKKARKKYAALTSNFVPRGRAAKVRRAILPI